MKIFTIGDLSYTAFNLDSPEFRNAGIQSTDNIKEADIFVAKFIPLRTLLHRLRFVTTYGRNTPILLWSSEPRDVLIFRPFTPKTLVFPELFVMNMYTGGVYRAPGSYYGYNANCILAHMTPSELSQKKGFAVTLTGYKLDLNATKLIVNGKDIDQFPIRQRLITKGFELGLVDIYGGGWPNGMSFHASGHRPGWVDEKLRILNDYRYNVALENTGFPLYITEKIWHAIKGRCLPLYSSFNSSIYSIFSRGSFVDVEDFATLDDLFEFLQGMTDQEFLNRYNQCVDDFNRFHETHEPEFERAWCRQQIVHRLVEISTKNPAQRPDAPRV